MECHCEWQCHRKEGLRRFGLQTSCFETLCKSVDEKLASIRLHDSRDSKNCARGLRRSKLQDATILSADAEAIEVDCIQPQKVLYASRFSLQQVQGLCRPEPQEFQTYLIDLLVASTTTFKMSAKERVL